MLWNNNKYNLTLSNGCSSLKLDSMFGVIQQLSFIPKNKDTIWSVQLLDKDKDAIYEKNDHEGRLDVRDEIPVGNQSGEELTLRIYDSTFNDSFKVIVKVREII